MIFTISALFLRFAKSEDFIVGDNEEWSSGTNYQSWSKKYDFSVGDVLGMKFFSQSRCFFFFFLRQIPFITILSDKNQTVEDFPFCELTTIC